MRLATFLTGFFFFFFFVVSALFPSLCHLSEAARIDVFDEKNERVDDKPIGYETTGRARKYSCDQTRPPPGARKFESRAVDSYLEKILPRMKDTSLARIFNVTLPNALDTTFDVSSFDDTFVITGDIDAMWIRDATFQVMPYMKFLQDDEKLRDSMCGLLKRQSRSILLDPYANAFNFNGSGSGGPHQDDKRVPKMTPSIFEGKYELDSLICFLKLGNEYARSAGPEGNKCFTSMEDKSNLWLDAVNLVLETLKVQQSQEEGEPPAYQFWRSENDLCNNGTGSPTRETKMIKSAFRPSDDPTTFAYHIPSNWMAVHELTRLNETLCHLETLLPGASEAARKASDLAEQVSSGLQSFGLGSNPSNSSETILVYEADGYGNQLVMDDANAPSLLSLSYLGCFDNQDDLFRRTRAFVNSLSNPYYFEGKVGRGVGSPHIGSSFIWPLSIIYSLFGATEDDEIMQGLEVLKLSTAGTNCMHESFWKDDVTKYTRHWFAWANSAFGELILHLIQTKPHLILE